MTKIITPFIESTIKAHLHGHHFDIIIKVNVYGELLDSKCLFLDLPPEVQKMTLGLQYVEILEDLKSYMVLQRYKIVCELNKIISYNINKKLVNELNELQTSNNLTVDKNIIELISDSWVKEVYQLLFSEDEAKLQEFVNGMLYLTLIPNNNVTSKYEEYLKQYTSPLLKNVIRYGIPFLHKKNVAYEALAKYPCNENRDFLINELSKTKLNKELKVCILKGLFPYNDQVLYDNLIDFYERGEFRSKELLVGFLNCMLNYKTEKVKQIAWKYIAGKEEALGNKAHKILRNFDVTEKEIADAIKPVFYDTTKSDYLFNIIARYHHLLNSKLLPSDDDLINTTMRFYNEKNENLSKRHFRTFNHKITSLMVKVYNDNLPAKLHLLLSDENPLIKESALTQIRKLFLEYKTITYKLEKETILKIIELAENDVYIFRKATESLRKIADAHKPIHQELIEDLIELIPKLKSEEILVLSMKFINNELSKSRYNDYITTTYLGFLDHKNNEVVKEAVLGLSYSPSQDIKANINKVQKQNQ